MDVTGRPGRLLPTFAGGAHVVLRPWCLASHEGWANDFPHRAQDRSAIADGRTSYARLAANGLFRVRLRRWRARGGPRPSRGRRGRLGRPLLTCPEGARACVGTQVPCFARDTLPCRLGIFCVHIMCTWQGTPVANRLFRDLYMRGYVFVGILCGHFFCGMRACDINIPSLQFLDKGGKPRTRSKKTPAIPRPPEVVARGRLLLTCAPAGRKVRRIFYPRAIDTSPVFSRVIPPLASWVYLCPYYVYIARYTCCKYTFSWSLHVWLCVRRYSMWLFFLRYADLRHKYTLSTSFRQGGGVSDPLEKTPAIPRPSPRS